MLSYGPQSHVNMRLSSFLLGGTWHLLCLIDDVTDRKLSELKLEAHLEHLEIIVDERTADLAAMNEELTVINEELQEATDAKSAFLASMSHELRTPLNSIIGFSGVLSQGLAGPLSDVQLNQIGMINKSGRHLLKLIEGILDLAKIEAKRMEIDVETVDAGMLVREVADFIRPLAEEKHLALGIQVPGGKFVVNTDVVRLKQILLNLVGNAVKFTDHGEIRIIAEVIEGRGYAFTVTDTGPGIAEADMVRVFDEYTQLEWLDAGKPHGTGLGLHLSQEFAVLLGGHISVESEVGTGSSFTLFLPDLPIQSPEGLR